MQQHAELTRDNWTLAADIPSVDARLRSAQGVPLSVLLDGNQVSVGKLGGKMYREIVQASERIGAAALLRAKPSDGSDTKERYSVSVPQRSPAAHGEVIAPVEVMKSGE
jgi:hypothetical protein